ncbi:uncharacterized protein GIQ15_04017 [Arthroderma uncinatum]|uniref:uncharacterized protein n=1 Tax=Arthroderma uncinatum TaxID=74035 RepID=UPI00144ABFC8|nr:uncharacterized protein GIQ15_04017 [Arthroderma uncinatum]KAF3481258.1 hypothetical protein GIQ15_04017 [Arthroderma uncinatum]
MPQPHPIYPKLHVSSRLPESFSAPGAMVAPQNNNHVQRPPDMNQRHQVLRAKRKHVLKACDRFVEMLESHHALVVKALQRLYTHCIDNKCFPGEPIEIVDGYPLTHAILDRLGLIKQAEEQNITHNVEAEIMEASKYWKNESSGSNSPNHDGSPIEPCCPLDRSRSSDSCSTSPPSESDFVKCESSPSTGVNEAFRVFGREGPFWPMNGEATISHVGPDYNRSLDSTGFNNMPSNYSPTHPSHQARTLACTNVPTPASASNAAIIPSTCPETGCRVIYPNVATVQYTGYPQSYTGVDQQTTWAPQPAWSG